MLAGRLALRFGTAADRASGGLRLAGGAGWWLAQGAWAWVSLRPGSRPNRCLRRLADRLAAQPALAAPVRRALVAMPPVDRFLCAVLGRIKSSPPPPSPDAEAAGVRRLHRMLLEARAKAGGQGQD